MLKRTVILLSGSLSLMMVYAQQLESPIETRVDKWQPVLPGKWTVSTKRFEAGQEQALAAASTQAAASACPYPSLFFLRNQAPVKLGEPGCQFRTYRVSKNAYHIVARCRTLAAKDHYETTTLTVSNEGKAFSSATTWIEPQGGITVRTEGVWLAACEKE
jgi:Protein of unknown function (DUF3617)